MSDTLNINDITDADLDGFGPPVPPPARSRYGDHIESLLPHIRAALDAGDRLTLLKRFVGVDRDGKPFEDTKRPVWDGYNDPATNGWGLADLKFHLDWAIRKGIEVVGYGVIMGSMSRNRFALDFDAGDKLHEIADDVKAQTGIDIMQWPRVRSGRATSPGYHLHARSETPVRSSVLARCADDAGHARVICEIVGEGKQLVGAGSKHKSGRLYAIEYGDPNNPPTISGEELTKIMEVVRKYDTLPRPEKPVRPTRTASRPRTYEPGTSGRELADRYNAETTIEAELSAHGYVPGSGNFWVHPNNDSGQSVHVLDDLMAHHFGANDPYGCGETSTPFALYAHFAHGGDWSAAVKAIAAHYGLSHAAEAAVFGDAVWPSEAWEWLDAEYAKIVEARQADAEARPRAQALRFDLSRLPQRLARGIAGIAKANPLLPLSSQVLVPFAYAGAMIGKRRYFDNMHNKYYPNLWTVCVAGTNSNKTGTRNLIIRATPLELQLPDTATIEALIDRIGRSVKTKDRNEIAGARNVAIQEDEKDLRGGIIIADEVTGTLKRLLGGDGKQPDRNVETLLRLATSGERYDQPTVGAGQRMAYDLCVSLLGWTQADTWQNMFNDERYRSNGFIGRVITCCDGIEFDQLPDVPDDEWKAFVGALAPRADDGWDDADVQKACDFGIAKGTDPIREAMLRVMEGGAWHMLADTVGEYAKQLWGKIIGHAIKLAMICEWFEGQAGQWFEACAELVTACYANYFYQTYGKVPELTQQHQEALVFIRQNPGKTVDMLRRKLSLREKAEAWQVLNALQEADLIVVSENPKRKGSHIVHELPSGGGKGCA